MLSIPLPSLLLSIEWLKLRSALTIIPVPQPMTSNPQPNPYCIFSAIYFFSNQTEKWICFHTRKPSFPQGSSDDAHLAKSPEIRHFSAFIYLFLTANIPSPRLFQFPREVLSLPHHQQAQEN